MSIATTTAIAIGVGVAGAAIGGISASKAAGAQRDAANQATAAQRDTSAAAIAEDRRQFDTTQANLAPWLKAGTGAVGQLSDLVPQLNEQEKAYGQFQAPTAEQAAQTPGYQFQLAEGQKALERSAAARGNLLTGGTAKALDRYSQDYAASNYQNTYNNALNAYQQGYNQFQNSLTNQYNRLAGLAGTGQNAANTLGQIGQQSASNIGNIYSQLGQNIGQNAQNAGAATASGYVGIGNSINSGIGNAITLNSLLGGRTSNGIDPSLDWTANFQGGR